MISANIIADSRNTKGQRITTFVLVFPRIVLAEFNTHRMISKNSASSRAIPFKTMLQSVQENPFIPLKFMKEHKGMQGIEYFETEGENAQLKQMWLIARDNAAMMAGHLNGYGLTKQMCNRLLEPFLYHTVIATATDWDNFFALRAHPQAEIHIQDLAFKMLEAYNASEPNLLQNNQWHIPFGDKFDLDRLQVLRDGIQQEIDSGVSDLPRPPSIEMLKVMISTARCARISYNNFEGKDDYLADYRLHNVLSQSGHWSPFEHCAYATSLIRSATGNFNGWFQYRKQFDGENKTDARVLTHKVNESTHETSHQ